ncbi:MAG: pentapeptide repeat-containing protein [Cellulosilyticaceae bacterium]
MAINKKVSDNFHYKNAQKLNKNFMYKNLKRSNCYDCDFSGSNFDYTSLRGAHLKSCNFFECSFKFAEFVGTNLKKSRFKKAKFDNVVFEGVNLDGVDFNSAEFVNTIFIGTDITKAKNLNVKDKGITIYDEMPKLKISEALTHAVNSAMSNENIKEARVLDTKEGKINSISMIKLLENFDEEILIKGLNKLEKELDKDFCTLSYIIKSLQSYKEQELI